MSSKVNGGKNPDIKNSFNNVQGFALAAMNTDVFKKTEHIIADDISDFITEKLKPSISGTEDRVEELSDSFMRFFKKTSWKVTAGLIAVTVLFSATTYLVRKRS